MGLTQEKIEQQSWAAYNQWRNDWIKNTKLNKKHITKSLYGTLENIGKNKTLLVIANGPSLGRYWDLIKKRRQEFHIICVDKSFKPLMEHGITPDYVTLCDANVSFEKYCKGIETKNTILISNIAAESNWIEYWQGPKFFFINQDSIKSEDLFISISEYGEMIPAASNVSNAQIMLTYFILKYRFNLMLGYDYSWKLGTYYSTGTEDKECWMGSQVASDNLGEIVRTSGNLTFSSAWIAEFFKNARVNNYINCSGDGLLNHVRITPFEECLNKIKLL